MRTTTSVDRAARALRKPHQPTLLDWQERLDEAVRGCLEHGMTDTDVAEWVSETLRED